MNNFFRAKFKGNLSFKIIIFPIGVFNSILANRYVNYLDKDNNGKYETIQ